MEVFKLCIWIKSTKESTDEWFAPEIHTSETDEYHWQLLRKMNFMDELNARLGERVFVYELHLITPSAYFTESKYRHTTQDVKQCIETEYYDKNKKRYYTQSEAEHLPYDVFEKLKKKEYNHFKSWVNANISLKEREEFYKFLIRGGIKNVRSLLRIGEKLPKVDVPVEDK